MAFESVKRWFGRRPERSTAQRLYDQCVAQARQPALYTDLGVPDTMEGRFDLLVLHVVLVVRRLRGAGARDPLAQSVFDTMTRDLDDIYREKGYGDSKVARLVREHAEQFYGRAFAYEPALAEADADGLAAALARNVFADEAEGALALADYALRADAALSTEALRAGRADFPAILEDTDAAA